MFGEVRGEREPRGEHGSARGVAFIVSWLRIVSVRVNRLLIAIREKRRDPAVATWRRERGASRRARVRTFFFPGYGH